MPEAKMEIEPDFTPIPEGTVDPMAAFLSPLAALGAPGTLGTPSNVEKELDLITAAIRLFHVKVPDLVMRECSGYSARLCELTVLLHRVEGSDRKWARIRTMQVQKILDEVDRQWKTASRLIEVQRQDLDLTR